MNTKVRVIKVLLLLGVCTALSACARAGEALNPFADTDPPIATLGERNDHALDGNRTSSDSARAALTALSSYQQTHSPEPINPVMKPSVVRLMWVPDHLNSHGDLVPAHYYYLKVRSEQWALQDAFEIEGQLGKKTDASSVPYTFSDQQ